MGNIVTESNKERFQRAYDKIEKAYQHQETDELSVVLMGSGYYQNVSRTSGQITTEALDIVNKLIVRKVD